MSYPQFNELSPEMKIQVIRKCYPIPYVRLRQSCRHLDEISEQNGKNLGIYCYRQLPQLYLTNTLWIPPFGNWKANTADFEDYEKNKKFDEALSYFLEVARDLNFRYVSVRHLTTEQIGRVLCEWNARGIIVHSYRMLNTQNFNEITQMNAVKKMPNVDYTVSCLQDITPAHIEDMVRGKEIFYLNISGLSHEIAIQAYNNLQKIWADSAKFPRYFLIQFSQDLNFFEASTGYNIPHTTHINQLMDLHLNFTELGYFKKKYDIYLSKERGKNTWRTVSFSRTKYLSQTQVYLCLRTGLSSETLFQRLFLSVNACYPGHALDYSSFYEKVKNAQTVEEIKEEYTKLTKEMLRFYKKIYRRSILNVACELVTEWWNWPRWILEFTKRRPIEKRPPIVDLGYVLFQEILCPIYQYSTMPYSL